MDWSELLSNYIDGTLDDAERTALEARLSQDANLRRELAALQQTVMLVKNLPTLKAPRNFTITPQMVKPRQPRILTLLPVLSAAAAAMIILILGGSLLFQNKAANPTTGSQVAMGTMVITATRTQPATATVDDLLETEPVISETTTEMSLPAAQPSNTIMMQIVTEESVAGDVPETYTGGVFDTVVATNEGFALTLPSPDPAAGQGLEPEDDMDDEFDDTDEQAAGGAVGAAEETTSLAQESPTIAFFATTLPDAGTSLVPMSTQAQAESPMLYSESTETANTNIVPPGQDATNEKATEEALERNSQDGLARGRMDKVDVPTLFGGFLMLIATLIRSWFK